MAMIVCCTSCFKDPEIRNMIDGFRQVGNCPLCGAKGVHVCDSDNKDDFESLKTRFETVFNAFIPYREGMPAVVKTEVLSLEQHLCRKTSIFKISQAKVLKLLSDFFPNHLLEKTLYVPLYLINPALQEQFAILSKTDWTTVKEELKYKSRFHATSFNIDVLNSFVRNLTIKLNKDSVLYRARINNTNTVFTSGEMDAPPRECASSGRANPRGIRVLYLSDNHDATVAECRARVFDYVCIAEFRLKRDLNLLDLCNLDKISPFRLSDEIEYYLLNYPVLKDIGADFIHTVREPIDELEYVPTQYICDVARQMNLDGVQYVSTVSPRHRNIVLFNPADAEINPDSVRLYKVGRLDYDLKEVKLGS